MKDNYLPQALYLFTYSILALFILSLIPPFALGNFTFKQINLISDLQSEPEILEAVKSDSVVDSLVDSTLQEKTMVLTKLDTCQTGVTCIEDYSLEGNALHAFTESLDFVKTRPVRIAFYGDSFIEGDILTSSLRDTLQRVFGGRGVGYMPITSEVAKFRMSIKHTFENWQTYSIVGQYDEEPAFGIGGYCVEPTENNYVEFSPAYGAWLNKISLFYSSSTFRELRYTIRDTVTFDTTLNPTYGLTKIDLTNLKSKTIKLSISSPDSVQLYGVSIEDNTGVYVDNLAMRGNSGIALSRIPNTMLRESQRLRPYQLVIFQFGLNVVSETDSTNYSGYASSMVRVVNKFKESFPGCSILIVSVSDRSSNQGGTFKTIPGILLMRDAQRLIAKKAGVAFWDLLAAMGGENSMPKFVNAKPSMAAKDYTHLNFKGGRYVAKRLADALLYEQDRYAKNKTGI